MNNATPTKSVTRWLGNGWLRAGLLALVLCAVYGGPAWQADYVHDDNPAVLENGHVRWPPPLQEIFSSPYFGTQRGFLTQGLIRPLVTLSFAAEIPLGLDTARRRHLVQLALYWLVCLLVASLAGRIARSLECDPRRATYFAWAAALLFAVHPVHAEVVMAIAYRPDLLALLMLLPATTALLDLAEDRPAGKLELFSIPLLFGLSLLCKESAMAILGPWLLWALFRRRRHKRALVVVTACLAVALLYIAWRSRALGGLLVAHIPVNDNPLAHVPVGERLTGACALIWHALCQMLWPSTIAPDYTFDALPVVAMTGWRTLGGGLVLVALCALLVRDGRQVLVAGSGHGQGRGAGWQALAVAWLGALYLPTSSLLFPSTVLAADRLLFAPSLAVVLVLGWLASGLLTRGDHRRTLVAGVLFAALLGGGLQAHAVANDWRSDLLLYERGVRIYPRCLRMRYNLGQLHLGRGETDAAIEHLDAALKLRPDDQAALTLLIQGHTRERRCQGVEPLVRHGLGLDRVPSGLRKAVLDWAITCRRFELGWHVGQTLTRSAGEWPRKVFIAAVAAGEREAATRWAQRFVDSPWQNGFWVAAAVFADEHADRPKAALGHLVALQGKQPKTTSLNKVAQALCKRHTDHVDHAEMVSMTRAAWPNASGRTQP